jgi:hypothetical protein
MKIVSKTYTVQTRSSPYRPWSDTFYHLKSKRQARQYAGNLDDSAVQWRILERREVIKVLATRPWKSCLKQRQKIRSAGHRVSWPSSTAKIKK